MTSAELLAALLSPHERAVLEVVAVATIVLIALVIAAYCEGASQRPDKRRRH